MSASSLPLLAIHHLNQLWTSILHPLYSHPNSNPNPHHRYETSAGLGVFTHSHVKESEHIPLDLALTSTPKNTVDLWKPSPSWEEVWVWFAFSYQYGSVSCALWKQIAPGLLNVNSNLAGNQMLLFKVVCHGCCFCQISTKYIHNIHFCVKLTIYFMILLNHRINIYMWMLQLLRQINDLREKKYINNLISLFKTIVN